MDFLIIVFRALVLSLVLGTLFWNRPNVNPPPPCFDLLLISSASASLPFSSLLLLSLLLFFAMFPFSIAFLLLCFPSVIFSFASLLLFLYLSFRTSSLFLLAGWSRRRRACRLTILLRCLFVSYRVCLYARNLHAAISRKSYLWLRWRHPNSALMLLLLSLSLSPFFFFFPSSEVLPWACGANVPRISLCDLKSALWHSHTNGNWFSHWNFHSLKVIALCCILVDWYSHLWSNLILGNNTTNFSFFSLLSLILTFFSSRHRWPDWILT